MKIPKIETPEDARRYFAVVVMPSAAALALFGVLIFTFWFPWLRDSRTPVPSMCPAGWHPAMSVRSAKSTAPRWDGCAREISPGRWVSTLVGHTFRMPPMILGCLEYRLRSGETFADWHIEQPMTFDARDTRDVTIRDVFYAECIFTPRVQL